MNLHQVFTLLVIFQVKHFVSDFPLQREYMLKKTLAGWDFVAPLGLHALVHAVMTLFILLFFTPALWYLAIYDFVIHFIMDRIKSGPKYLGRYSDKSKSGFWNALGFDQMVHHLTHYSIVWFMIQGSI